jgi:hypothetical protein
LAPLGVLEPPRVQLATGLPRTRQKPTSLPTALVKHPNIATSFINGGSAAHSRCGTRNQPTSTTWYARDSISHQPQLKSSPVAVRRLSFGQPEPWLLARLAELNGESTVPFAAREFGGTVNRVPFRP